MLSGWLPLSLLTENQWTFVFLSFTECMSSWLKSDKVSIVCPSTDIAPAPSAVTSRETSWMWHLLQTTLILRFIVIVFYLFLYQLNCGFIACIVKCSVYTYFEGCSMNKNLLTYVAFWIYSVFNMLSIFHLLVVLLLPLLSLHLNPVCRTGLWIM